MRVNQNRAQRELPSDSAGTTGASLLAGVNAAIADAVERMEEEEARLRAEIGRLNAELRAVEKARVGLVRGNRGVRVSSAAGERVRLRAPKGFLPKRILEVLGGAQEPLARGQIIEQLRVEGYQFTLAPAAITRELVALVRARKIRREGADNAARYALAVRRR